MSYLIYTIDKPNSEHIRAEFRSAHYEFLTKYQHLLIASGGLQEDDGRRYIGGAILLDVDTREQAQAIADEDPFASAGLFETVSILRWKKAFFLGERTA